MGAGGVLYARKAESLIAGGCFSDRGLRMVERVSSCERAGLPEVAPGVAVVPEGAVMLAAALELVRLPTEPGVDAPAGALPVAGSVVLVGAAVLAGLPAWPVKAPGVLVLVLPGVLLGWRDEAMPGVLGWRDGAIPALVAAAVPTIAGEVFRALSGEGVPVGVPALVAATAEGMPVEPVAVAFLAAAAASVLAGAAGGVLVEDVPDAADVPAGAAGAGGVTEGVELVLWLEF